MAWATALTVAGSDSSAGAGIQADLRTFAALDIRAGSAITAVTAQGTAGVIAVHPIPVDVVVAQIDSAVDLLRPRAVKTGMLPDAAIIAGVADALERHRLAQLVVDPVLIASSGHRLMREDALTAFRARMLPMAAVLTPNLPEAEALLGRPIGDLADRRRAAQELLELGPTSVVLKGGHASDAIDVYGDAARIVEIPGHGRIPVPDRHGTGCAFSAALAAHLAHGRHPLEGARLAKSFVEEMLLTDPITGRRS